MNALPKPAADVDVAALDADLSLSCEAYLPPDGPTCARVASWLLVHPCCSASRDTALCSDHADWVQASATWFDIVCTSCGAKTSSINLRPLA